MPTSSCVPWLTHSALSLPFHCPSPELTERGWRSPCAYPSVRGGALLRAVPFHSTTPSRSTRSSAVLHPQRWSVRSCSSSLRSSAKPLVSVSLTQIQELLMGDGGPGQVGPGVTNTPRRSRAFDRDRLGAEDTKGCKRRVVATLLGLRATHRLRENLKIGAIPDPHVGETPRQPPPWKFSLILIIPPACRLNIGAQGRREPVPLRSL